MNSPSNPVSSTQRHCHPRLGKLVYKHLYCDHLRPPAAHTLDAFKAIRTQVQRHPGPLVFDSFCGTGMSTTLLAQMHPDSLVIGIDKSAHRLDKHAPSDSNNYLLVRADCGDFWRLAVAAGWMPTRHYLLYPNPWPKPGHLQRRLHGSPDFSSLLALGGLVELRSNWQVYVEEFGVALHVAGHRALVDMPPGSPALTLFEQKYVLSGHQLWRCRCMLRNNMGSANNGVTA